MESNYTCDQCLHCLKSIDENCNLTSEICFCDLVENETHMQTNEVCSFFELVG